MNTEGQIAFANSHWCDFVNRFREGKLLDIQLGARMARTEDENGTDPILGRITFGKEDPDLRSFENYRFHPGTRTRRVAARVERLGSATGTVCKAREECEEERLVALRGESRGDQRPGGRP